MPEPLVKIGQDEGQSENTNDQVSTGEGGDSQDGRPEYLAQEFWDEESRSAKVEALASALKNTQTALRNRQDEIRNEILKELNEGLPGSPEEYKIELGDDSAVIAADDDPLLSAARKWAHENRVSPEALNKLAKDYANIVKSTIPDREAELKRLGDNADTRLRALGNLATARLKSADEIDAFSNATMTAAGVRMMESLLGNALSNGPMGFEGDQNGYEDLRAQLNELKASDNYWKRDTATLQRVENIQARLARMKR